MPLVQLIVLAIVQGITEFLPISSSAHLILVPIVADGWTDQGALIDLAAHLGTLGAVLLYFRSETAMLTRGAFAVLRNDPCEERKLFLFLAGATLPILVFGGALYVLDLVDALRSPTVIAATSILFGVLLWHADRRPQTDDRIARVTWREAMSVGAAQMLALVPGVSRSGITMTAARYLGWSRTEAARFSMLLAIPVTLVFSVVAVADIVADGANAQISAASIVAALSFVTAYATIAVFLRLTRTMSFTPFVIYRILLGLALFAFAGQLSA